MPASKCVYTMYRIYVPPGYAGKAAKTNTPNNRKQPSSNVRTACRKHSMDHPILACDFA